MIEVTGNDLVVIASDPQELADGQAATIEVMKRKEAEAEAEVQQAEMLVESCMRANIGTASATRALKRAESRHLYLTKVRQALEEGYVIVPNFPGRTIAVRVKRDKPSGKVVETSSKWAQNAPDQIAQILPVGEGRYVDVRPIQKDDSYKETDSDGKQVTKYLAWATDFSEEFGLPVEFMKPTVIQRTGKTMARKIFDEIAITGDPAWTRGDPMVLGRIRDRKNRKEITFLVAWFVDTAVI